MFALFGALALTVRVVSFVTGSVLIISGSTPASFRVVTTVFQSDRRATSFETPAYLYSSLDSGLK